jgi:UDP-N-acetylmuramoylalanine-D-glutamate ligase
MQSILWDRRIVLSILDAIGVSTPKRVVVSRDGGVKVDPEAAIMFNKHNTDLDIHKVVSDYAHDAENVVMTEDAIQVANETLDKPFLEKPVNGEDHNINIYYSKEQGGGGRRLFRKVGNKSSEYDPELSVPKNEGSWVYEAMMEAENAEDIKVYTVGQTYIHAETRKSVTKKKNRFH